MKGSILLLLLGLAACAAQRQAEYDRLAAECRATTPSRIGDERRRQECIVEASKQAGLSGAGIDLMNATRIRLGEEVDRGALTQTQAEEVLARIKYEIESDQAAQRARQAAAAAMILGTMPRPTPVVGQPYVMPPAAPQPWAATCTRMGNLTNCFGN